jgi:uncharacterized protein (TIGR02246 family)
MTKPEPIADQLIDLERRALERWCRGDPSGFLEISAPDVVYFDPFVETRIDGRDALAAYYEALRGKIQAAHFEIIGAHVQLTHKVAVLTFNFTSRGAAGGEQRWNCTEVYREDEEGWRIIQTHWSLTKHQEPGKVP